jgi:hypothetical protein
LWTNWCWPETLKRKAAGNGLAADQCGVSWLNKLVAATEMETKFENKSAKARTAAASGALWLALRFYDATNYRCSAPEY